MFCNYKLKFKLLSTTAGSFKPEKCPQVCANNPQRSSVQCQHTEEREKHNLPNTGQGDVTTTNCILTWVCPS